MLALLSSFGLIALFYVLFICFAAFNTWMIVDAARKDKFVWLLVAIGVPFIGAIVYYFTEKKVDDERKSK